jgi:large subunit ribosomal protein L20
MARVRSVLSAHRRKKRVLKAAKGQFGHRSKRYQQARRSLLKGMSYHSRDMKVKKRDFRSLWIVRINAACKEAGTTYSRFISGLLKANVEIDRKVMAELAVNAPDAFKKLIDVANAAPKTKVAKAPAKVVIKAKAKKA